MSTDNTPESPPRSHTILATPPPASMRTPSKRPRSPLDLQGTPLTAKAACHSDHSTKISDARTLHNEAGFEVYGEFVGPMPPQVFLDTFMQDRSSTTSTTARPATNFESLTEAFSDSTEPLREERMYGYFCDDAKKVTPTLHIVDTSKSPDSVTGLKPDICVYDHISPHGTTDFAEVELFGEFKVSAKADPFSDDGTGNPAHPFELQKFSLSSTSPPSKETPATIRGQITNYAAAAFALQFRTHLFSFCIFGTNARLMRWDASGVVVSKSFPIAGDPEAKTNFLAEFFWRFDGMTPVQRGRDPSVFHLRPGSTSLAKKVQELGLPPVPSDATKRLVDQNFDRLDLSCPTNIQTCKRHRYFSIVTLPAQFTTAASGKTSSNLKLSASGDLGNLDGPPIDTGSEGTLPSSQTGKAFLISSPLRIPPMTRTSPFGRRAREVYAYDLQEQRLVILRSYWRTLADGIRREDSIYAQLHSCCVPHIPSVLGASDIPGDDTVTRTETYKGITQGWKAFPTKPKTTRQLYIIVLKTMGIPLNEFQSTLELTKCVRDVAVCIKAAADKANILHRNIGLQSILIDEVTREGVLIHWDQYSDIPPRPQPRQAEREGTWQFRSSHILAQGHVTVQHSLGDDFESLHWTFLWTAVRFAANNLTEAKQRTFSEMFDQVIVQAIGDKTEYTGGDIKQKTLVQGYFQRFGLQFTSNPGLLDLLEKFRRPLFMRYFMGGEPHPDASWDTLSKTWYCDILNDAIEKNSWPVDDAAQLNAVNPGDMDRPDDPAFVWCQDKIISSRMPSTTSKAMKSKGGETAGFAMRRRGGKGKEKL